MMRRDRLRALAMSVVAGMIVVLGGVGLAGAGDETPAKGTVDVKATFARLKKLVGTWKVELDATGKAADFKKSVKKQKDAHGGQEVVVFKLTGAGSALVETQLPGHAHEMVSVYHLDGDDLRMTHYCAAGNQPRFKLDKARSRSDHLVFTFDGGTNLDVNKDMHIHGLEITFHEDGRVTSDWEGYMGGKSFGTTSFIMTRQDEKAAGH
jgi:hypothetical protein